MKTVTEIGTDLVGPELDYAQNSFLEPEKTHRTGHSLALQNLGRMSMKKGMPWYRIW